MANNQEGCGLEEEELLDHWVKLIRRFFPVDAKFTPGPYPGGCCLWVGWKLKNDPARSNKPSRKIRIVIDQEAIEDYREKDQEGQRQADERLKEFVKESLKGFDPEHELIRYQTPPIEDWVASGILGA
jgi:hypothetical protein